MSVQRLGERSVDLCLFQLLKLSLTEGSRVESRHKRWVLKALISRYQDICFRIRFPCFKGDTHQSPYRIPPQCVFYDIAQHYGRRNTSKFMGVTSSFQQV